MPSFSPSRSDVLSLSLAGLNTLFSILFQLVVVYRLGVGGMSDLYYGATIVTAMVCTIFLDSFNNVLIPVFVDKAMHEKQESAILLWNSFAAVLVGGLALLLIIYFPVRFVFSFIFGNLRSVSSTGVGKILVTYLIYQILFGAVLVKNCFLFAMGRPLPAQIGVLLGWVLSLILALFVDIAHDVSRIALCLIAGCLLSLALPNLGSWIFFYRRGTFLPDMLSICKRMAPLTSGSIVSRAESLVDGVFASWCGSGSLTIYHLFARFLVAISTVVNSGYIQPATKRMAELARGRHWSNLRLHARRVAMNSDLFSLGLLTCVVVGYGTYRLWPMRTFEPYARIVQQNWLIFLLMAGYLLGTVASKVYATGLIVLRREKVFAGVCLSAFALGILMKFLGSRTHGLAGLAAGTSFYWLFTTMVMATAFQKSVRRDEAVHRRSSEEPIKDEKGHSRPLHVVFVNLFGFSNLGGVELHILNLSKELIRSGVKVTLLCREEREDKRSSPSVQGIRIVRTQRWGEMFAFFRRESCSIDICHAHMSRKSFPLLGLLLARWFDIATVFTPHCFYPSTHLNKRIAKRVYDYTLTRLTFFMADCVINLTPQDQKDSLARGLPIKKSRIIPNSVDLSRFKNGKPVSVKAKYGIRGNFLLHVGRFEKQKCIDFLVCNHCLLMPQELSLVLVGQDDGELKTIMDLITKKGLSDRICVLERLPTSELCSAYQEALAFVMASRYEGLPTVILEAAAFGTPTIAPRVGGIPFIIEEGRNGHLYEWGDSHGYVELVRKLCKDKKRIDETTKTVLLNRFSWEVNAKKIACAYAEILERKPNTATS